MFKSSSVKETGPSSGQNFVCSDNPGQNIWSKIKKYSKIEQDFQTFNFLKENCALSCVSTHIRHFSNFLISEDPKS